MQSSSNKQLNLVITGVVIICLLLLLLRFFGYGTLQLSVPASSTVLINGHEVNDQTLHLAPGDYTVAVYSPSYQLQQDEVHIGLFGHKNYQPQLSPRDPISVLTSAIGVYGLYGKPTFDKLKWFDGDQWVAGVVGPGSTSFIALHYSGQAWRVAYFDAGSGYPHNIDSLPSQVRDYVNSLRMQYAGS